jgi:hypothetical protein
MKIACISAANIESARGRSASVRACETVRDLVGELQPQAVVDIMPLIDYELQPCRMCGECVETQRCAGDEAFNRVFEGMIGADAIFVVVPHYAPLPSKLMMLTEKMEEMAFLGLCADSQNYSFPLRGQPAGVIAHGGQEPTAEVIAYYQRALVEPVAGALRSVTMEVIGAGEEGHDGVAFGIRSISRCSGAGFVDIQHDWPEVRARIAPLVWNVVNAARKKAG